MTSAIYPKRQHRAFSVSLEIQKIKSSVLFEGNIYIYIYMFKIQLSKICSISPFMHKTLGLSFTHLAVFKDIKYWTWSESVVFLQLQNENRCSEAVKPWDWTDIKLTSDVHMPVVKLITALRLTYSSLCVWHRTRLKSVSSVLCILGIKLKTIILN